MSNKINYSTLTQELIKGLRGKKSQNYYNKRLKQKTNQIHRWETGKSKITWVEFMRLLQLFKIDFRLLLNRFFRFQGDVESISLFLTHLFGNKKISELSKTVQLSEFKIRRILNGSSPAYLADILKIIDLLNRFRFLGFLNALIDLNKIGEVKEQFAQISSFMKTYYENPRIGHILLALRLDGYKKLKKHDPSFLAQKVGISLSEVAHFLEILIKIGYVTKKDEKYLATSVQSDDSNDPKKQIQIRKYWTAQALLAMENHQAFPLQDAFGSLLFTTNSAVKEKIISIYLKFFEDLKNCIMSDKREHDIVLALNFHLFDPVHSTSQIPENNK
ncbi:MAG: hypothetical protein A2385_09280 [Bdellovibrionales bacterium RIFOXYB1_FULL_39_21]|nr:MAG: hypothetical protein A2385_09280 [Bdellovibrionales bacterium RIFOXYB1_FULL_39_21]OFZ46410.1 MAG: hypothetical protein A2404_02510 [Bdellovibrionales bacterium RIFOXYC1_FULL_39_130]OFZ75010.1 MAG: hypothetical protein A2560_11875 [Bdellovibrionales bacterium RIFOXYD1_FULL_39_84]HLE10751.1 DUF4423 domain-containing protein [Bacteriovoracaceae bacterium]